MPLLRRFALLAVVAAGFGVLSGPASARTNLDFYVDSANFRVHYQSDKILGPTYAITETQAGDIAARAERALAAELADGYPRPLSDGALGGDGRIDIYVEDFTAYPNVDGSAGLDSFGLTSSGYIYLAGNVPEQAFSQHTIAHELFHLIQFAMWIPQQESDYWLMEATAEWMGFRVNGYPAGNGVVPMAMALDCRDPFGSDPATPPTYDSDKCDLTDNYLGDGYSRWPFFEYVIENQGAGFIKNIFAQGLAGSPTALSALGAALAAGGTSLAETYNNWAAATVRGGYSVPSLQARPPEVYGAPINTGTAKVQLPQQKVAVNHLSTRILQFDRGGGSAAGTCYAATLTLSVTIPAGTQSKPVFYWNMPGTPIVVLSVNGGKATANVPWDTCQWSTGHGYLVLPNASTTVDAADFVVDASLDVNTALPATAADPPPGAVVTTPIVQVPSGDAAPTLSVFGPQLVKLSPTVKQIRLIVESNGSGTLQATLGSVALGSQALRIGNNDVRFALPAGVLQSLRRSASSSSLLLTLTPLSASGSPGVAVTRQVSIAAAEASVKKPAKKPAKTPAKKPAKKKKTGRK